MNAMKFALVVWLIGLAGCARENPSDARSKDPQALGKPEELILGQWTLAEPADKSIDWSFLQSETPVKGLRFKRDNGLFVIEAGRAPGERRPLVGPAFVSLPRYIVGDGVVEIVPPVVVPPGERLEVEPAAPPTRTFSFCVSTDELVLTDDKGNSQRFQRVPAADVKISGLPLCCASCGNELEQVLVKVPGVSNVSVDHKAKTVSLKVNDSEEILPILQALTRAGMRGEVTVNGKPPVLRGVFNGVAGFLGKPPNDITIKGVHACCTTCQENITGLFKGAQVTFVGDGPVKKLKISGEDLDVPLKKLTEAGYFYDVD
ncbi:MAG: cation transporter [Gemmataceae bacterium]